jgi:hypothetical protein
MPIHHANFFAFWARATKQAIEKAFKHVELLSVKKSAKTVKSQSAKNQAKNNREDDFFDHDQSPSR